MAVRTSHIRTMLEQAQRLAAMAETALPTMQEARALELERAAILAEHAAAELRDELFLLKHGWDIDSRLLGADY